MCENKISWAILKWSLTLLEKAIEIIWSHSYLEWTFLDWQKVLTLPSQLHLETSIKLERDLQETGITEATIEKRFTFGKLIDTRQFANNKPTIGTNEILTEEGSQEDEEISEEEEEESNIIS